MLAGGKADRMDDRDDRRLEDLPDGLPDGQQKEKPEELPEVPVMTGSGEQADTTKKDGTDEKEETEKERARAARRRRRRSRARRERERQIRLQRTLLIIGALFMVLLIGSWIAKRKEAAEKAAEKRAAEELQEEEEELLSDSVLQYRDLVEYYAEEEGIEEYVPVLLAIMEAETKGERDDVMQSSESAGLEPNTLGPEDSIAQACDYFRGLVDRAEDLGCDKKTIIQAYNYGPGYMYYVAERGGKHSFDLAVEYAEKMSDGRTARYTHYIADDNGNWMYLYGNMYYVKLVEQYLPE